MPNMLSLSQARRSNALSRARAAWAARVSAGALLGAMWFACITPAHAQASDRMQPLDITAARGTVDGKSQVLTYAGNVVVRQGSMTIEAERIEVREMRDGRRTVVALGVPDKPARFRKKTEGKNEFFEGVADRVDYDDRSDQVRFVGNATARRLVGNTVADEVTGGTITYDYRKEFFSVEGKDVEGSRRVRAVFAPRGDTNAATPVDPSASRPAATR